MKKTFFILLAIILSLLLVACAASVSTTAETSAETTAVANAETDTEADVETDAEADVETTVKIKLTWPKDKLGSVPQLKGITITDITDTEDGVSLTYEGGNDDTAKMYIEQLKRADWEYKTLNDEIGKIVTCSKPGEHLVFTAEYSGAGSFVYSTE
ncbi:MAG: hypothetical protein HN389_06945 [Clostridia bacterium]|jgi:hypothetical protein|nr:hypothetical protein [Clostridia bacterium]